jgi:hypothetical protein
MEPKVEVMGVEPMSCSPYHKWTTRLFNWFSTDK